MITKDRQHFELNVANYYLGIYNKIAHCLAQNLLIDWKFDAAYYIKLCNLEMVKARIPKEIRKVIIFKAIELGYAEYEEARKTGNRIVSTGASQVHPSVLLGADVSKLAFYVKQLGETYTSLIIKKYSGQ